MKVLEDLGPSKLMPHEQQQIRDAADSLFFCEDFATDPHGQEALAGAKELAARLTEAGRWIEETAQALVADLEATGPAAPVV